MDRASWMRVLERWSHCRRIETDSVAGYKLPADVPVLDGPVDTNEDGTQEQSSIAIYIGATEEHWRHPREELPRLEDVWGKYIVPDYETCVLVGNNHIAFIPWDAIVYIRG